MWGRGLSCYCGLRDHGSRSFSWRLESRTIPCATILRHVNPADGCKDTRRARRGSRSCRIETHALQILDVLRNEIAPGAFRPRARSRPEGISASRSPDRPPRTPACAPSAHPSRSPRRRAAASPASSSASFRACPDSFSALVEAGTRARDLVRRQPVVRARADRGTRASSEKLAGHTNFGWSCTFS